MGTENHAQLQNIITLRSPYIAKVKSVWTTCASLDVWESIVIVLFLQFYGKSTVLVRRVARSWHAGMPEWSKGPDSSTRKASPKKLVRILVVIDCVGSNPTLSNMICIFLHIFTYFCSIFLEKQLLSITTRNHIYSLYITLEVPIPVVPVRTVR